jgi:hypothetical protein
MMASKSHVFLSWHNIEFTVPLIKNSNSNIDGSRTRVFLDIDDPRVTLLTQHNNSMRVSDSSIGISSPGRESDKSANLFNLVNNSSLASENTLGRKNPTGNDMYS